MLRRFGAACAVGILKGLAHLPYGWIARLGNAAGRLCYVFPSERRRIARINLALCFPHWSVTQRISRHCIIFGTPYVVMLSAACNGLRLCARLTYWLKSTARLICRIRLCRRRFFLSFTLWALKPGRFFSIIYCSAAAALYTSLSRIRG